MNSKSKALHRTVSRSYINGVLQKPKHHKESKTRKESTAGESYEKMKTYEHMQGY